MEGYIIGKYKILLYDALIYPRGTDMRKFVKVLGGILLTFLLLVAGVSIYVSINIGSIARNAIETQGSKTTGTTVKLGGAHFIFLTGRIGLSDLVIGNPAGFKTPEAFRMKSLVLHVSLPTLLDEVVVIREFSIDGARITAEQAGTSLKTNLQVIADHARSARGPAPAKSRDTKPVKLVIEQMTLSDNQVELVSDQWGKRQLAIPDMTFRNLGRSEGGLTPEQLSQRIMVLVTREANRAVRQELQVIATEKVKEGVSSKLREKMGSWLSR